MSGMMIGGPEAVKVVEELLAGENPAEWKNERGFYPEQVINRLRYAIDRDTPLAPKLHPGKYGHKYDSYTCTRCGAVVDNLAHKWCWNCGQALSDAYLGRKKTTEEQMEHQSDLMKKAIQVVSAARGRAN